MEAKFLKNFVSKLPNRNNEMYLDRAKAIRWLEGLVDKTLPDIRQRAGNLCIGIRNHKAGPSMNLKVEIKPGLVIDVDFVLAFVFPGKMLNKHPRIWTVLNNSQFSKANEVSYIEQINFALKSC